MTFGPSRRANHNGIVHTGPVFHSPCQGEDLQRTGDASGAFTGGVTACLDRWLYSECSRLRATGVPAGPYERGPVTDQAVDS